MVCKSRTMHEICASIGLMPACHAGTCGYCALFWRLDCHACFPTGRHCVRCEALCPVPHTFPKDCGGACCTLSAAMHTMQDADGCLWCVQLVQTYTRGMLPGLWPYIWSCVIMKVSSHIECSSKHLKSSTSAGLSILLRSDHLHLQRAGPILDHSLPIWAASNR